MTFFQGQMAFTRCILFTRFTREQNTTCKGHLAFQKVIYSRESAIHSFSYPNIHSFYYECRKGTILHEPRSLNLSHDHSQSFLGIKNMSQIHELN